MSATAPTLSHAEMLDLARQEILRRRRISEANAGRIKTQEHRRKLSESVSRMWAEKRAQQAQEATP